MTSPANRIRAALLARNAELKRLGVQDWATSALEALLPVVEKRREWHESTCAIDRTVANGRCTCPAMEAEQALLTAASALGAEDE